MAVFVCGDTHGTHDLMKLMNFRLWGGKNLTKDDYVIVCGDFGLLWNNKYFVENYNTENFQTRKTSSITATESNEQGKDIKAELYGKEEEKELEVMS